MENIFYVSKTISSLALIPIYNVDSIMFLTASTSPTSCLQIWSVENNSEPYSLVSTALGDSITSLKIRCCDPSSSDSIGIYSTNCRGELVIFSAKIDTGDNDCTLDCIKSIPIHRGACSALDILEEKNQVATVGDDGCVSIVDMETLKSIKKNQISENGLNSIKYISSSTFVTASHSLDIDLWDIRMNDKRPLKTFMENNNIMKITSDIQDKNSNINNSIYSKHSNINIDLDSPVDINKNKKNDYNFIDNRVFSIDNNPAKPWLICSGVSGSYYSSIIFHDIRATQNIPILSNYSIHQGNIWKVLFYPTSPNQLISCSDDGSLVSWDTSQAFSSENQFQRQTNTNRKFVKKISYNTIPITTFDVNTEKNIIISAIDNESLSFIFNFSLD